MAKKFMSINCFEPKDTIVLVGSCLKTMQPKAFSQLEKISPNIFEICLEETHLNMAIAKLVGVFSRASVKKVVFATVDKSPHCIQMHYIENELRKAMSLDAVEMLHFVATGGNLVEISKETIKRSRNLSLLETLK